MSPAWHITKRHVPIKELETCSHVFLRRIAIAPPLTDPYYAPHKVVSRSGRVFKILQKGKVELVTADCVKPAHIEPEPEPGITQKRQMQPKSLPTANKPAAIARKPRTARAPSRSTITPVPLKTGEKSGKTTNTSLRLSELDRVQQALHGQIRSEHGCPTRQHFIMCRIPGRTLLLALTGRMGVFERTREYHCI